jgi:hypothetical protein
MGLCEGFIGCLEGCMGFCEGLMRFYECCLECSRSLKCAVALSWDVYCFLGLVWDWDVYRIFVGLFMGCLRVSVGVLEVLLEVDGIWSDFT